MVYYVSPNIKASGELSLYNHCPNMATQQCKDDKTGYLGQSYVHGFTGILRSGKSYNATLAKVSTVYVPVL